MSQKGLPDTKKWNFSSLKWRMLFFLALVAVGYVFYIGITLSEYRRHANLLNDVHTRQYPVQSSLLDAILTLEKIQLCLQELRVNYQPGQVQKFIGLAEIFSGHIKEAERYDPSIKNKLEKVELAFGEYFKQIRSHLELASLGTAGYYKLQRFIKQDESRALYINSLLVEIRSAELQASSDDIAYVANRANTVMTVGAISAFLGMLLLGFFSWLLYHRVNTGLGSMVTVLKNIEKEEASLSMRIPIKQGDEISELAFWLNRFIAKLQDLSEKNAAEMHTLAYTDTVTDLPNRRSFNQLLKKEIETCRREHNTNLTVFFIDLDDFKNINDQFGHDAGDSLLQTVAQRLGDVTRARDTLAYNGKGVVARMGGDEFMVLVSSAGDPRDMQLIAERMRAAVCAPIMVEGIACEVGVSIGIASYPYNGKTAEDLIINADAAMYEAKKRGKNYVCFFDHEIGRAAELSIKVESLLHKALENNETEFYVQPKYDLLSGEINGAELLMRWNSKELGLLSPEYFIGVAKKSRLIYKLDEWALRSASRLVSEWQQQGILPFPISVNVSARQTVSPGLVPLMQQVLQEYPVALRSLEIEISEATTVNDFEVVVENIKLLQEYNVKIALDDFGSGHSSLTLLKYCEIDTLKIDVDFITEMEMNKNCESIVEAVVALSHRLGIEVVAEGVETEAQISLLKKAGCNSVQGFFYAEPMPLQAFEQLLRSHNRTAC